MRRLRRTLLLLLATSVLASCSVERGEGVGSPCAEDGDCPDDFFCGADDAAPDDEARICVPDATCNPANFGAACAGAGRYTCVDDEVIWTSCEPGFCEEGACRE